MKTGTTRLALLAAALVLAGCTTQRLGQKAPVVDRSTTRAPAAADSGTTGSAGVAPALPGAENAGKPGYFTVRPGDTLIRIGLETGQNWRDIQAWNQLANPNLIEVGQVLRVAPPGVDPSQPAAAPVSSGTVAARPLPAPGTSAPPATSPAAPATVPAAAASADAVAFVWPVAGSVIETFDEVKNKGVDIAGKLGEPVLAAADGRVVYAGAGLRGYGNLIILKHNNTYLTAYAHNQSLLVREDQAVKQGQKIAEMGSSDADRVKLHFEVRRQGKPVDPLKYLPGR
ncbi:peptidoglycan DD-metalloendopeptidase family protein [Hydrogenophaga atypica]|uniref:Peptidoglycan DD-metalloendopeptidase family protein n=1 Tax=Hydrogenophaga atypica TaxID=249409 RepID=A0ABW2QLC8_9BURK